MTAGYAMNRARSAAVRCGARSRSYCPASTALRPAPRANPSAWLTASIASTSANKGAIRGTTAREGWARRLRPQRPGPKDWKCRARRDVRQPPEARPAGGPCPCVRRGAGRLHAQAEHRPEAGRIEVLHAGALLTEEPMPALAERFQQSAVARQDVWQAVAKRQQHVATEGRVVARDARDLSHRRRLVVEAVRHEVLDPAGGGVGVGIGDDAADRGPRALERPQDGFAPAWIRVHVVLEERHDGRVSCPDSRREGALHLHDGPDGQPAHLGKPGRGGRIEVVK